MTNDTMGYSAPITLCPPLSLVVAPIYATSFTMPEEWEESEGEEWNQCKEENGLGPLGGGGHCLFEGRYPVALAFWHCLPFSLFVTNPYF